MTDKKPIELAKELILEKTRYRIRDMGYNLNVTSTSDKSTEENEPTGIVAIIFGRGIENMTDKEREKVTLAIPSEVTPNDGTYHPANESLPTFPGRIHYVIQN